MSKQTITPGKWKVIILDGDTYINPERSPEGFEYALIARIHNQKDHKIANAQAIAAVPDMIEALRRISEIVYRHNPTAAIELAKDTAMAALRKAGQID